MGALFVIREVSAWSLRHRQDETAIIHVQSVAATDQLVLGIARERAIGFAAKVRLVEGGQRDWGGFAV